MPKVSPYDSTGACYKRIEDVPERIDAVNLIISPKIGLKVLDSMGELGIRLVALEPAWMSCLRDALYVE